MYHKSFTKNKPALLAALAVFGILFSAVLLIAFFYDFSEQNLGELLFVVSFLCCVIVAKNIYDVSFVSGKYPKSRYTLVGATQSLYTQLYQKSPVPYFVIRTNGEIVSANTAALRLLDEEQCRMVGKNAFDLIRTEKDNRKAFLIEKFKTGVGVSGELVSVIRADKREVWALLSLFRFENEQGETQGLLTLVDITKQKKAENAKTDFVSLASHQLRTPLAGMKWSAELLQMDNADTLTKNQNKYLNRLLEGVSRMSVLVDDFLRVSRFDLGNFTADPETVVLKQLFVDIMSEQLETATHKGIVVEKSFDPAVGEIVIDPNLFRMVITNLFSNAVKYTSKGGKVTISFKEENNMLHVQIADTGMGIPIEDQEQIFTKLFRAKNAVRDVPDGTGLGLYIVREAVAVMRGRVSFISEEGQGSRFDVWLPLDRPVEG